MQTKFSGTKKIAPLLLGALALLLLPGSRAPQVLAAPTSVKMRDPSTIIKRGATYWVFGTGKGVQQYSSPDLKSWTQRGQIFSSAPAWAEAAVPGNRINVMWAPDVHEWDGVYHLYYSFSSLGSNNSAIGLATSTTLEPGSWVDQGAVIISQRGGDFNAIDPSVFLDTAGKPWMAYGSYWSGLKLTALDRATGKRAADAAVVSIASRPGVPGNAIEAPAIYFREGYYYLFVNWNGGGAYNIRVGRSQNAAGPFLDKTGKSLADGGGSLFLNSVFDDRSGRPFDDQTGPGHVGILRDGERYWVSTHYEWNRANNGATTMNINPLIWDADGWPRAILDMGPTKICSILPTYGVLTASGAALQNTYFQNLPGQWWTLSHRGGGFYSVINRGSGQALSVVAGAPGPAAKTAMLPFGGQDAQLWFAQQNEDGTYTLLSKSSGQASALDIDACSSNDGAPVNTFTSNGLNCQKWAFRTR